MTDSASGDVTDQCARSFKWKALRNPGIVYGGKTSQDEPVVVELTANRKTVSHAHLGWYADCERDVWWSEAHDEFDLKPFPISSAGTSRRSSRSTTAMGPPRSSGSPGKVGTRRPAARSPRRRRDTRQGRPQRLHGGQVSWKAATG